MTHRIVIVAALGLSAAGASAVGFAWPYWPPQPLRFGGVVEVQEVGLGSRVAGRVAAVRVREGETVEPGQVVLVLDLPDVQSQVSQAQARVRVAEAELAKARVGSRATEVEAAHAAAAAAEARWRRVAAGSRAEDVRQARGDLEAAEADAQLGEAEYARAAGLGGRGSLSKGELDAARARRDRGRGMAASMKAKLDAVVAGPRPEEVAEARADRDRAHADYRRVRDGTRAEDLTALDAKLAEARGALAEADIRLAEREVRAAERGVVEVVAVRPGDLVAPGQTVVRVLRVGDLWVRAFVPETDLGRVRLGQSVTVGVDSYPGRRLPGAVTHVAAAGEFTPRNVQTPEQRRFQVFGVKVAVDDPSGVLKPGMAADVELPPAEAP